VGVTVVVCVGDGANVFDAVGGSVLGGDTVLVGDANRFVERTVICIALDVFVQAEPTKVRAQNIKIGMVFLLNTF
jgi:hypothetical protein